MNIFALDSDPVLAARYHCDRHVIKMIVESAQILSTAHRILDGTETVRLSDSGRKQNVWELPDDLDAMLYKATHANHPSCVWVRQSNQHYDWAYRLMIELGKEFTYRYDNPNHRTFEVFDALKSMPKNIPSAGFVLPTPAMPDQYKSRSVVKSYRDYYIGEKQRMAVWTRRPVPEWFVFKEIKE